jgi:hypothetical protein
LSYDDTDLPTPTTFKNALRSKNVRLAARPTEHVELGAGFEPAFDSYLVTFLRFGVQCQMLESGARISIGVDPLPLPIGLPLQVVERAGVDPALVRTRYQSDR